MYKVPSNLPSAKGFNTATCTVVGACCILVGLCLPIRGDLNPIVFIVHDLAGPQQLPYRYLALPGAALLTMMTSGFGLAHHRRWLRISTILPGTYVLWFAEKLSRQYAGQEDFVLGGYLIFVGGVTVICSAVLALIRQRNPR